jgi:cell division protein FtsW (lipid II flippase)
MGPKDSSGRPVLKPLRRVEFDPSTVQIGLAVSVAVLCLIGAVSLRLMAQSPPTWILALASIALAYPLASMGYTFFKDDELGGYIGKERWLRLGICAAVFALTWGVYAGLAYYFGNRTLADVDPMQMAIFLALMFGLGIAVSVGACELEVGQSFLHYSIYFVVTLVLALIAGVELAQPLSNRPQTDIYGIPSRSVNLPTLPSNTPKGTANPTP